MDQKPWYSSKTILANILVGLGLIVGQFVPGVNDFIQAHFTAVGDAWAIVNVGLRLVTSGKIQIG